MQNKSYFEVKIQSGGVWGVGVACSSVQLDTVPMGMCGESWVLRDGGAVFHNGEEVARAKEVPQEGDIIVSAGERNKVVLPLGVVAVVC